VIRLSDIDRVGESEEDKDEEKKLHLSLRKGTECNNFQGGGVGMGGEGRGGVD